MRKILLSIAALLALSAQAFAADNYQATAGTGLTFAAKDNGSSVYFPRHIMCDNTTTTQCVAVDASGRITVLQGGTWTVQPGNTANTTPWLVTVDNTLAAVANNADDVAAGAGAASPVANYGFLFDGTNWDRQRSGGVSGFAGVSLQASPTGGCTPNGVITSAASTNATNVKASAGTLCDWSAGNTSSTLYWVHFYNTAGTPTCNTGIIESYPISAAPSVGQVGGWSRPLPQGRAYSTGIGICITANADGTGNAAASAVTLNIGYK